MLRYLALICLASLSGCQGNSTGPTEVKRKQVRLGADVLSLPIGADGMAQKFGTGANWTFDWALWRKTIGQIGKVSEGDQPQFGMLVRSDAIGSKDVWPSYQPGKKLDKAGLAKTSVNGLQFYRASGAEFRVPPFFMFFEQPDGFVYCSGIAGSDRPDLDHCRVHVRGGNVQHSFSIAQGQLPFAAVVAQVFLAAVDQPT